MAVAARVLVVEDSEAERIAISQALKSQGFAVFTAEDADKALSFLQENIDVVLCDIGLGAMSGMDLLGLWKQRRSSTRFILLTGRATLEEGVAAIKAGAYDYLAKPQSYEKLNLLVRHALEVIRGEIAEGGARDIEQRLNEPDNFERMIGRSPQIQQVFTRIQRAAPVDSTVLVLGENGTGKELVAQALHQQSPRAKAPFVAVNVAAVPATLVESELFGHVRGAFTGATDRRTGRFEQANGGTLFIDEIGDFELSLQPKLLRVLETLTLTPVGGHEDIHVDVRVVAATSRNLTAMVREGKFREDLYYRLNVVQISLPPLRERAEDVPMLAEHFVKIVSQQRHIPSKRISADVMDRLRHYSWPGNIRELHNTLESMMVLSDGEILLDADLPDHIRGSSGPSSSAAAALQPSEGGTVNEIERRAIFRALDKCGHNRTHAAKQLGISVRTLQRKLHEYQEPQDAPTTGDEDAMQG